MSCNKILSKTCYHSLWILICYIPLLVKGTCKPPTRPLNDPENPSDYHYCHPGSADTSCPTGASCETLWLGLYVCCSTNDTLLRDDPIFHSISDGFSDVEPSDRRMKNRKNFAIFLPAEGSTTGTTVTTLSPRTVETVPTPSPFVAPSPNGRTSGTYSTPSTSVKVAESTSAETTATGKPLNSYSQVFILQEGTNQRVNANTYKFPASVTLIKDNGKSIIIDTGLPTDYNLLELFLSEISRYGVEADTVDVVITTHGHPDHFGHLNLFPSAVQYFGGLMYYGTTFSMSDLYNNEIATLSEHVTVYKTPGHTAEDLSVLARNASQLGTVAVVGDLFITKEDIETPEIWESQAWNATLQHQYRKIMLCAADYIVPGHGAMFKVEPRMRQLFDCK